MLVGVERLHFKVAYLIGQDDVNGTVEMNAFLYCK